jgi:hypothetical protein
MSNETAEFQPHLVRLSMRRSDVIKAAKKFDSCMSEFEGDMTCCHEDMDVLFGAVEKLRREEHEINNAR